MEDRKEFIRRLAETDNISVGEVERMYSINKCGCDESGCGGWKVFPNVDYLLKKCKK